MLNAIPFIGWFLSLIFSISLAIPFWFCWTVCGLGTKYFYFIPKIYQTIPFWHCVGLFIIIGILKAMLIPRLANFSNNQKVEKDKDPNKVNSIFRTH